MIGIIIIGHSVLCSKLHYSCLKNRVGGCHLGLYSYRSFEVCWLTVSCRYFRRKNHHLLSGARYAVSLSSFDVDRVVSSVSLLLTSICAAFYRLSTVNYFSMFCIFSYFLKMPINHEASMISDVPPV